MNDKLDVKNHRLYRFELAGFSYMAIDNKQNKVSKWLWFGNRHTQGTDS